MQILTSKNTDISELANFLNQYIATKSLNFTKIYEEIVIKSSLAIKIKTL